MDWLAGLEARKFPKRVHIQVLFGRIVTSYGFVVLLFKIEIIMFVMSFFYYLSLIIPTLLVGLVGQSFLGGFQALSPSECWVFSNEKNTLMLPNVQGVPEFMVHMEDSTNMWKFVFRTDIFFWTFKKTFLWIYLHFYRTIGILTYIYEKTGFFIPL